MDQRGEDTLPDWFTNPLMWLAMVLMTVWSLQRFLLPSFDRLLGVSPEFPCHTWQEASVVIASNLIAAFIVLCGFVVALSHPNWNLRLLTALDATIWGYMFLLCASAVVCIGRVRRVSEGFNAVSVALGMYATLIGFLPIIAT